MQLTISIDRHGNFYDEFIRDMPYFAFSYKAYTHDGKWHGGSWYGWFTSREAAVAEASKGKKGIELIFVDLPT